MNVLVILLPLSTLLAAVFLWMFVRAVSGGQFDDIEDAAMRAVLDEEPSNFGKKGPPRAGPTQTKDDAERVPSTGRSDGVLGADRAPEGSEDADATAEA